MTEKLRSETSQITLERLGYPLSLVARRPLSLDMYLAGEDESNLPEGLSGNAKLVEQAEQRRGLCECLRQVYEKMGAVELDGTREEELVSEEEVIGLYEAMVGFLKSDESHDRLVMYLPFEVLPRVNETDGKSPELIESERRFGDVYVAAWKRLLGESDLRSTYVDGDIPEDDLYEGELPRVRKAAHFVGELVGRGLVSVEAVVRIAEEVGLNKCS